MRFLTLDIRDEPGKARDRSTVNLTFKTMYAKQYLQERGLRPFPIGRCWAKPYTPPDIDTYGSKLQEALLNGRVHRP